MSKQPKNTTWLASGSDMMRRAMHNRCLASDVAHLKPIIDALPPGSVVCESGCGPGGITLDIAQKYPHLSVLGIDIDFESIKLAKDTASEAGITNVLYSIGDAVTLTELSKNPGFEALDGGCDLVYSHAAIMHMPDQLAAIKQMRRAAKPSGTVSLKEGDMGLFFAYPESPGMKKWLEVFPLLGSGRGADPYLGRKLLSLCLKSGYTRSQIIDISMNAQMRWKDVEKSGMAMAFGGILDDANLVGDAGIGEQDVKLIKEGLREWAECEDGIVSFPSVVVTCAGKES